MFNVLLLLFFGSLQVLFLHHLWIGPLVVVVVAILCWNEIGLAALPGVFLFVLLVPLQGYVTGQIYI